MCEFKVGVSLGLIMGIIAFIIAALSLGKITVAAIVSVSLCIVVSVGNIVGLAIPLFFRFIKLTLPLYLPRLLLRFWMLLV